MKNVLARKDDGGKEIIMEVGLAAIGVALLILFRNEITSLVKGIMNTATSKIDSLFNATMTSI